MNTRLRCLALGDDPLGVQSDANIVIHVNSSAISVTNAPAGYQQSRLIGVPTDLLSHEYPPHARTPA